MQTHTYTHIKVFKNDSDTVLSIMCLLVCITNTEWYDY